MDHDMGRQIGAASAVMRTVVGKRDLLLKVFQLAANPELAGGDYMAHLAWEHLGIPQGGA